MSFVHSGLPTCIFPARFREHLLVATCCHNNEFLFGMLFSDEVLGALPLLSLFDSRPRSRNLVRPESKYRPGLGEVACIDIRPVAHAQEVAFCTVGDKSGVNL